MNHESEALRIFLTPANANEAAQQAAFEFLLNKAGEGMRILSQAALMQAMQDNLDALFASERTSTLPSRPKLEQLRQCFQRVYRQAAQTLSENRTTNTGRTLAA